MRASLLVLLVQWVCAVAVVAPASAQRCEADLETCAREAYEAGNYELALARFRAMLAESPTPALRLAIAQCSFQLGRFEESLLALEPIDDDATVAAQARALRELARARLAASVRESEPSVPESQPSEPDPPEPVTVEEPAARGGYSPSWLLWTGVGVTAAGALLATIAGVAVLDLEADWNRRLCSPGTPMCDDILGRYDVAAPLATTGFALAGVGLGLLLLELALGAAGESP